MNSNFYLQKASEAHRQKLLREAERERMLAQLPPHRRGISRQAAGKLGTLLLRLGSWLKQFEQKFPTMLEDRP